VRTQVAGIDDIRVQITKGATPDVVVGSVHAVTEDGILVAVSASGSQLGPYAAGAAKVVFVVGGQKFRRADNTFVRAELKAETPGVKVFVAEMAGGFAQSRGHVAKDAAGNVLESVVF
jgi:hypothetical protein